MNIQNKIRKRIERINNTVNNIKSSHGEKPSQTHNYHGGWSLGYWEGRLGAYEDFLELIEYKYDNQFKLELRDTIDAYNDDQQLEEVIKLFKGDV